MAGVEELLYLWPSLLRHFQASFLHLCEQSQCPSNISTHSSQVYLHVQDELCERGGEGGGGEGVREGEREWRGSERGEREWRGSERGGEGVEGGRGSGEGVREGEREWRRRGGEGVEKE